jgi:DNA repair protein RadD
MELRPYQHEIVSMILDGTDDMLIQAPTGAGKTIMFSKCLQEFANRGQKSLVLAHRGELIRQAEDKLKKSTGMDCGVFSAYMGRKEIKPITVASIQSLARFNGPLEFDNIIIDEAHRVPDPKNESQYSKVLGSIDSRLIGFTATPYRLDSGKIYGDGQWWPTLNYQIPLRQLIDEGHLSDYLHRVSMGTKQIRQELKKVKVTAGEYNEKQSNEMMVKSYNLHSIINTVQQEKSIVVFCVSIEHAEALKSILKEEAGVVHSKMSDKERDENLKRFDDGELRWMLNVGVLTEGWDCTRVDAIVLARPTKSTALYVQMVGRGLRLHDGKRRCVIYDIVGNYDEFGFVDDPEIHVNQKGDGELKPKVCPGCFAVIQSTAQTCPECGFSFKKEEILDGIEDDSNKEHEMQDLSINEHPDFGDVYKGWADEYESTKGNKCLRVGYFHTKRKKPVIHYYPMNKQWIGTKLAIIARKYNKKFNEQWLSPVRFMKAVNGGHIFPMQGLMVRTDEKGFDKISTL